MNIVVKSIKSRETYDWLLYKHYAKRIPSISYSFGLYLNEELNGICTFGYPPNYNYNNGKCVFYSYECLTLELNRLVVNENLPKNSLSIFVSKSLKLLPKPSCIVSYADQNKGHNCNKQQRDISPTNMKGKHLTCVWPRHGCG